VQLAPANLLGFMKKVPVGKGPVFAGLIVGEIVVIWLTFFDTKLAGTINVGLIGLVANVVVLAVAAVLERTFARPETPARQGEPA
jgi:SSS family solute:Na+ symporter